MNACVSDQVQRHVINEALAESKADPPGSWGFSLKRKFIEKPVLQGDKLRMIDHGTGFGVNDSICPLEEVDFGGLDEVAAVVRFWAANCEGFFVEFTLAMRYLRGELS